MNQVSDFFLFILLHLDFSCGSIYYLLFASKESYVQPILVQEYQVFDKSQPIKNILVKSSTLLVLGGDDQIKSIRLDLSCSSYQSCAKCIRTQDPYCGWSTYLDKCVAPSDLDLLNAGNRNLVRDTLNGNAKKCLLVNDQSNQDDEYNYDEEEIDDAVDEEVSSNERTYSIDILPASSSSSSSLPEPLKYFSASKSDTNLLLVVALTALVTCCLSIMLTWLFIKKRYKMANYVQKHFSGSTSASEKTASNRCSSSSAASTASTSSYHHHSSSSTASHQHETNNSYMIRKFFSKIHSNNKQQHQQQKKEKSHHHHDFDECEYDKVASIDTTEKKSTSGECQKLSSTSSSSSHSPLASTTLSHQFKDTLSSSSADDCCLDSSMQSSTNQQQQQQQPIEASTNQELKSNKKSLALRFLKRNYECLNRFTTAVNNNNKSRLNRPQHQEQEHRDQKEETTQNLLTTVAACNKLGDDENE